MSTVTRLISGLAEFGTRSIVVHVIMALGVIGVVVSGLFIEGQIGTTSMVALMSFTAGLWICHSIHSLGNAATDDDYEGILKELSNYV